MDESIVHVIKDDEKPSNNQKANTPQSNNNYKKVVILTHSPVVYYYPSMIYAFIMGAQSQALSDNNAEWFLLMFFFNTLVVLFDFSTYRSVFITLGLSVIGLLLWNLQVLDTIFGWAEGINLQMNSQAFYAFGFFLLFMLIGDYIWAHLNRWVFGANEVKHVKFLVGEASIPGRGLSMRRKITDIFEYILGFGAGTVILSIGRRRVRLRNVIRAQSKISEIEKFIRTAGVYNDDADVFGDDFDDDFDDDL